MDAVTQQLRLDFDRLRGRLFELVELAGMPHKQEDAAKRLIRRQTYDSQSNLEKLLNEGRGNGARHSAHH